MVNKLIQSMIAIVIGLALLPVVNDFTTQAATGLTGAMASLVNLLPVLYVIILITGAIGYMVTSRE